MVDFRFGIHGEKDVETKEPEDLFEAMENARDTITEEDMDELMNEILEGSVKDFIEKLKNELSIIPDSYMMVEDMVYQLADISLVQTVISEKEEAAIAEYESENDLIDQVPEKENDE